MQAIVYNPDGTQRGTITLPDRIFGATWSADLVHQVVTAMEANARVPVAHTKGRGEVAGGGKKPWRQKGTGRARHGSIRSPIWRGGGVTHGPLKDRNYSQKINKKMRTGALYAVLSKKMRDGELLFVDTVAFEVPKTKHASVFLKTMAGIDGFASLATKKRNAALITLSSRDESVEKSFRNMGHVAVEEVRNLNPVKLLRYKYVIFIQPEEAVSVLARRSESTSIKK